MKASARIVAVPDDRGGTRLAVLRGESPLLLRRTGPGNRPAATVHLVGGAAGPLSGDDLHLEVSVASGASLRIHSVAAQLALPGRPGLPASSLTVHADVESGATLRWLPEPLIAAAGCRHRAVSTVEVADGGVLLWREDLVCGRHDEQSGSAHTSTTIRYAGQTLYRHDLSIGPDSPGWSGAAVLGGGRAVGTLVAASADAARLPLPDSPQWVPAASNPQLGDAAMMPLAGPGVLVTAVGADIRQVRAALDPFCPPDGLGEPAAPSPARVALAARG